MKRALLCVVLVGCAGKVAERRTFVQSAGIDGLDLVLTRCEVFAESDAIKVGKCATERQRLPIMVDRDDPRPATLDEAHLAFAITPAIRDALASCADRQQLGQVRVRLVINDLGAIASLESDVGGANLAACAREALARARFPGSQQGARLAYTFRGTRPAPLESP